MELNRILSKLREWYRNHHGFLTEKGKLLSWGRFHMLGLGLIFPALMVAEHILTNGETYYFLLLNILILGTAKLADENQSKWLKGHKVHAHYMVLGNFTALIIGGLIYAVFTI